MSLRKQWLLSILIVLLTALWWVGRDQDPPPADLTAAGSQPTSSAPASPVVRPVSGPSPTASALTPSPSPAATPAIPDSTMVPLGSSQRLLPAVHATTSGPHAFLQTNPDGTPVTWSPCEPIHYAVNSDEMPGNGMDVLHAAIDRVSAAAGLKFVQDPGTHAVASGGGAGLDIAADGLYLPVLISWATKQEFPRLGDHAGITYPLSLDVGGVRVTHTFQYYSGQIVLDANYYRTIAAQGWASEEQAIIMHELGHLVGLAHVHVGTELMNEDNVGLQHFGPGDLQGLAEAGDGRCIF